MPEASRASVPLGIEASAVEKRFLSSHSGSGESGVEIRAADGVGLGKSLSQENGKAADESVTGTGAVNALHRVGGNAVDRVAAGKERSICTQGDDHTPDATGQQFLCAFLGVIDTLHRQAGDCLGFAFVRHEIVESFERSHFDRLGRRWIQNAADTVFSGKCDRVVDGFERNLELEHDAVGGFDNENAVLSAGLDENWRDAARQAFELFHVRGIDSLLAEVLDSLAAEEI